MDVCDAEGKTKPCLIHHLALDDIPRFCEERVKLGRLTEAMDGNDRIAGDDVRTMEIRYGVNGERLRNFRESIAEMQEVEFEDFPLEPRTALPYLKAVASVGESCYGQHLAWVAQSKIPDGPSYP